MAEQAAAIYQLKVTLAEIDPAVWRRIQVRGDITFEELDLTLQVVMGWWNYHLHEFEVAGTVITDARTLEEAFDWQAGVAEHVARLQDYVTHVRQTFTYSYDFGDDWRHHLEVEHIMPAAPDTRYPLCLAGARACPPEDVGGVWGYQEYLAAMADPGHPEHEEYLAWRGPFDPEAFDAAEVNRQLREGVRWEGELVIAPLTSTREFTRPAYWFWAGIPPHFQAQLLGNCWCGQCRAETTLMDFRGRISRGDLVLQGTCLRCGGPVTRVIEGEG